MLSSKRLKFRRYTLHDVGLLQSLYQDWNWQDTSENFVKEFLLYSIMQQYDRQCGLLATFLMESNEYIGHCGLKYSDEREEWFLSFRFLKKYWREDLPTEAIMTCLMWGFNRLNLREIVVDLEPKNQGAAKTLEKAGFRYRYAFEENSVHLVRYSVFSV
jgi:[ribosomal protein S5]-alanine N-acetyltransferase